MSRRPDPKGSTARSSGHVTRLIWIVVAIALLVFLPALANDFVNWDDDVNFLENPDYRGLGFEQLSWGAGSFLLGHYHPLTWFTLSFDYALWGMNPAGYHLTNALLHSLGAALVFLLFRDWLGLVRKEDSESIAWAAAIGALLFALHPLRVESVAWASERRDVLSGVFVVATLLFYTRRKTGWALILFAAALLSKIIAVTLPVVLLLMDVYPLRRKPSVRLLVEKWPFALLAAGAAWIALGRYDSGVSGSVADLDLYPGLRAALSLFGLAFYVVKTVLPWNLAPQYVWATSPSPFDAVLLSGAAFVIFVTGASLFLRKRLPALPVAWFAYIVTLLPVLSIVRLDRQQFVADHHSYLATLGLAAIAAGLWSAWIQQNRQVALGAAAVLLALLAGMTIRQIGFWRDSTTLWTHTLEVSPLSIVAHNNLGRALSSKGADTEAAERFRRAAELEPRFAQAHYNLGSLLMRQGDLPGAQASLERAAQIQPSNAQVLNDLANCLLRRQKVNEALPRYEAAIRAAPDFADARYNYGLALEFAERPAEAAEQYRRATELDPANQDAWRNLGRVQAAQP